MIPKEKAAELILKFMRLQEPNYNWFNTKLAKQCALIAVDEILEALPEDYQNDIWSYWQEVKEEIEKL